MDGNRAKKRCSTGVGLGWLGRPRGATTTEYLIILTAGILVVMGGIHVFGGGLQNQFQGAADVASGVAGGEGSDRGDSSSVAAEEEDDGEAVFTGDVDRDEQRIGSGPGAVEEEEDEGGFNLLLLLVVIGGVLFLAYIIFSDD